MAVSVIIGTSVTLQAMFRDPDGTPVVVVTPLIDVFNFDSTGAKVSYVAAQPLAGPTVPEAGRYVYPYTVPTSFNHGDSLSVEMSGIHPISGDLLLVSETLNLETTTSTQSRLVVSFFS